MDQEDDRLTTVRIVICQSGGHKDQLDYIQIRLLDGRNHELSKNYDQLHTDQRVSQDRSVILHLRHPKIHCHLDS
jgi:hypothetical protein